MCFIIVDMSGFCTPTLDHFDYYFTSYGISGNIYSPGIGIPEIQEPESDRVARTSRYRPTQRWRHRMADARCVFVVMRDLPVSRDLLLLHITRRFRLKTTKRGRRRMND